MVRARGSGLVRLILSLVAVRHYQCVARHCHPASTCVYAWVPSAAVSSTIHHPSTAKLSQPTKQIASAQQCRRLQTSQCSKLVRLRLLCISSMARQVLNSVLTTRLTTQSWKIRILVTGDTAAYPFQIKRYHGRTTTLIIK
eukprot:PhF_6_TR37866/c0_g1_i1/m.56442